MKPQVQTCFKRYEKKYFLTPQQYELFKEKINPYVKADDYGNYTLCNIYYDTDDYSLIRESLEKPVYKEKLRVRSYGVPGADDTVFAEIKKKYDGVVYKRRAAMSEKTALEFLGKTAAGSGTSQIEKELAYFQLLRRTSPKAFIAYDREALQSTVNPGLRITFDTNLRFRLDRLRLSDGDDGLPLLVGGVILMEIKIPDACPLRLCRILSGLEIRPVSFSKYGTCYKNHILPYKKEMLISA